MKTLGILITGIFFVQTALFAQDVRVQSSPQTGEQTYTSFYWLDLSANENETTFREGSDLERTQDRTGQTDGKMHRENDRMTHRDDKKHNRENMMGHRSEMDFNKKEAIKDAVLHEMVSRGYEINPENPDLLVGIQVFDQSFEISNFVDDGLQGAGVDTRMPETIEVGEGTLMITITDRETGEMLSRGFLSEALTFDFGAQEREIEAGVSEDREQAMTEHQTKKYQKKVEVIQAVSSIFDRLQLGESATLGAGR